MRELYTFADEQVAHRFVSVLQSLQLPAHAEQEGASWIVWIENDDHRDRAQELLTEFRADPDAERFREAEKIAKQILAEKLEAEKSRQKLRKDLLDRWRGVWWKCHPAATTMVAISVFVVAISTELSPVKFTQRIIPLTCNVETSDIRNLLFIQETIMMVDEEGNDLALCDADLYSFQCSAYSLQYVLAAHAGKRD